MDPDDPLYAPPTPSSGRTLTIALGVLLGLSAVGNAALVLRGPHVVERTVTVHTPAPPAPPAPECPPTPECPACAACPEPVVAEHPAGTGTGGNGSVPRPPRPPPVDLARAAEGEGHLAHAETVGERDPVQVAAQRRVAEGVDRIVESHSPASAERFLQRNLPSLASMECAFRDPASAEHVRMRLRDINALARPAARLSEADLTRYERDLRCPRE